MNQFILATRQIALLALLFVLAGCKTTDVAEDGSLASIFISGHAEEEIQRVTIEVFKWNGFDQLADLTFEKQGTRNDTLMFGGLDSGPVWIKIRVHVKPRGGDRYVLGCDAYAVQNHGDPFIETETRLKFSKADECKDILDQIKTRLSLPAAKTT